MRETEMVPFSDLVELNPRPKVLGATAPFIGMEDVSESGHIIQIRERSTRAGSSGLSTFEDGDILFAKITPCMENGKGALVHGLFGKVGLGSTEFHVLRARPGVSNKYIYHWTRSQN